VGAARLLRSLSRGLARSERPRILAAVATSGDVAERPSLVHLGAARVRWHRRRPPPVHSCSDGGYSSASVGWASASSSLVRSIDVPVGPALFAVAGRLWCRQLVDDRPDFPAEQPCLALFGLFLGGRCCWCRRCRAWPACATGQFGAALVRMDGGRPSAVCG